MRAFSLVEVVIAVGVFAVAVTGILALLPTLTRQNLETADQAVALRLPAALEVELGRMVETSGFDSIALSIPVLNSPLQTGMECVATHDGSALASAATAAIPDGERYFLLEIWRFDHAPLAYDPADAVLAVYVRVSWPYRVPGAAEPTGNQTRNEIGWTLAINR